MANNSAAAGEPAPKPPEQRSKSCETACSSNSSCFFQKRKPPNPLASSLRSSLSRSTTGGSGVRQRVLSAKLLKIKSIQNQLNDANYHLAEVLRENQALKTLQKRQDRALTKYEGANAELPRMLKAHEEEIRILTEKNKILRRNTRDLNDQLKQKSDEIGHLQDQLKHFEKLDKDKHLLEREKLIEELSDCRRKLQKAEAEITTLNRRLMLETKTSKQRLNAEISRHKQCQKELAETLTEFGKISKTMDGRNITIANSNKRFPSLLQRQTVSLINLNPKKPPLEIRDEEVSPALDFLNEAVTEVKLEPITPELLPSKPYKSILKNPSEKIKARLSATSRKLLEDDPEIPSMEKLSLSNSDSSAELRSRPSSSQKLERIESHLQNTIKRFEKNDTQDEIDKRLGDYCLQAINSVKNYTTVIEDHKENYANAKTDTGVLLNAIHDAENMELKLKKSHAMSFENNLTDDNLDFVNHILSEEIAFKKKYKDRNGNKNTAGRTPEVGIHDKKKLLETLRAIDNGDTMEVFDTKGTEKKNKLMQELFGDSDE